MEVAHKINDMFGKKKHETSHDAPMVSKFWFIVMTARDDNLIN